MAKATSRQRLVQRIDAYCATHGITAHDFGRLVAYDAALVGRLRDERRRIAVSTVERAESVLRAPPQRHVVRRRSRKLIGASVALAAD